MGAAKACRGGPKCKVSGSVRDGVRTLALALIRLLVPGSLTTGPPIAGVHSDLFFGGYCTLHTVIQLPSSKINDSTANDDDSTSNNDDNSHTNGQMEAGVLLTEGRIPLQLIARKRPSACTGGEDGSRPCFLSAASSSLRTKQLPGQPAVCARSHADCRVHMHIACQHLGCMI